MQRQTTQQPLHANKNIGLKLLQHLFIVLGFFLSKLPKTPKLRYDMKKSFFYCDVLISVIFNERNLFVVDESFFDLNYLQVKLC